MFTLSLFLLNPSSTRLKLPIFSFSIRPYSPITLPFCLLQSIVICPSTRLNLSSPHCFCFVFHYLEVGFVFVFPLSTVGFVFTNPIFFPPNLDLGWVCISLMEAFEHVTSETLHCSFFRFFYQLCFHDWGLWNPHRDKLGFVALVSFLQTQPFFPQMHIWDGFAFHWWNRLNMFPSKC